MTEQYAYEQWNRMGFAVERDDATRRAFKRAIGDKGRRWTKSPYPLDAMQMAVLDNAYDMGEGTTFKAKDLLNDRTRMGYVISKGWTYGSAKLRGQESCGHDERTAYKYTIYAWDDDGNRTVAEEWYADEGDEENGVDKYEQLSDAAAVKHGLSSYRCGDMTDYKGECAWKDDDTKTCVHHDGQRTEHALIRYKHRENGNTATSLHYGRYYRRRIDNADKYDTIFWDEQDHAALIADVDDDLVMKSIKKAIASMRTEARPWLQSTRTEYTNYDHESHSWNKVQHGKRGHYDLSHFWHAKNWVVKDDKVRADHACLAGQSINGWAFKTFSNGHGEWQGTVTYHRIQNGFRNDVVAEFLHKSDAEAARSALVESSRISHRYNGGRPQHNLKVETVSNHTVRLSNELVSVCHKYTPQEYFIACHKGEVANEYNTVCHHYKEE